MGKTLQRFQRSGSKSPTPQLSESFPFSVGEFPHTKHICVILYQKCQALACRPTTVIEHSTLFASKNLICSSLVSQAFDPYYAFRSAYSDESQ
jgi:hypothetical protein